MANNIAADKFANYAIVSCDESAANTLTFKKLETGISLTEKVAWVINRVEYIITSQLAAMFNGDGDVFYFGLALSNAWSTPSMAESTILDYNTVQRIDYGTAAVAFLKSMPFIKDFSSLPGGGILVPPNPLYLYAKGLGLASANGVVARMHYTLLPLAVDQYWELVEARRVLSS